MAETRSHTESELSAVEHAQIVLNIDMACNFARVALRGATPHSARLTKKLIALVGGLEDAQRIAGKLRITGEALPDELVSEKKP